MKKIFIPLFALSIITLLSSCTSTANLSTNNFSYLYNDNEVVVKPEFYLYRFSPDSSEVFFRFSTEQVLYTREPGENLFEAKIQVKWKIYASEERTQIIDTGTVILKDYTKTLNNRIISSSVKIHHPNAGQEDIPIHFGLIDLKRNLTYFNIIWLRKETSENEYMMKSLSGEPIFGNYAAPDQPFILEHANHAGLITVVKYSQEFPLPPPPYIQRDEDPISLKYDTIFMVKQGDTLQFSEPGFYQFRTNREIREGYTLFQFSKTYPYVGEKTQLGPPLRYLSSNKEYEKIKTAGSDSVLKYIADDFWLKNSKNPDQGERLVKAFYSRVENANKHFTSYDEGWRTDRGLIYVVFGPPGMIYKSKDREVWVYGNENSSLQHIYEFNRLENPFSQNDYELTRSSDFRYGWGRAIQAWRDGMVYDERQIKREQDERDQSLRTNTPYFR